MRATMRWRWVVGLMLLSGLAAAAPRAELWERWAVHDEASVIVVDHSLWDGFLRRNVRRGGDGVNRVDYGGVGVDDRGALSAYLRSLQQVAVGRLERAEQRAFWINLYNALTVRVVLDHYPVASIRDIAISPGLFSVGPWKKKLVSIEGVEVSLDDIEHRILRPIWTDPRLHYALNCASLGCPNLLPQAFTAANTETLLEAAAREFVNHPRAVSFANGRLVVSSIYDWFEGDFGPGPSGVLEHLRRYADEPLRGMLGEVESISDHHYDWSLNDAQGGEGG